MPKRYFKYYLTAITAILFIACSEKDTLNGEGMLHLKVDVTDQVKVTTRSMTDELQDSLQRHCTIGILNEKGTVRRYKGVNELPEALYLSAGSYTALVTAGDSVPASFETVYYKEERPFHINSGEVTNLELTCGIANTVVAVKYDEALSSVFQTYKVTVSTADGTLDYLPETKDSIGYYMLPADNTKLQWHLEATMPNGKAIQRRKHSGCAIRLSLRLVLQLHTDRLCRRWRYGKSQYQRQSDKRNNR